MFTTRMRHSTFSIILAISLSTLVFPGCGRSEDKSEKEVGENNASSKDSLPSELSVELPDGQMLKLLKVEAESFEKSAKNGENTSNEVQYQATLTKVFYIGQTEVTQAQWKAVMGNNPSEFNGYDLPVEKVSWNDAMVFCEKLNSSGKAPNGWKFTLPKELGFRLALVQPETGIKNQTNEKNVTLQKESKTVSLPGNVTMELVKIEAGTFKMSAKDGDNKAEEVQHQATLTKDFYIGQTEVTQAQWKAVMGTNPSKFKGDDLPVEKVSWNDAMVFCEKLNSSGKAPNGWKFTLPTETQWEYAARGGKKSKGYKYSGSNNINEVAWYGSNSENKTHSVGKKKANELDLYDMSGNVFEWCLDDFQIKSDKLTAEFTRENDQGGSERALRGGCWYCFAIICRSADRMVSGPSNRSDDIGFRLVLVQVQ